MSREAFIQSEDKEFEVTFREVRNWEEYSDLDFETDTAPLTEEAGTDTEDTAVEDYSVEQGEDYSAYSTGAILQENENPDSVDVDETEDQEDEAETNDNADDTKENEETADHTSETTVVNDEVEEAEDESAETASENASEVEDSLEEDHDGEDVRSDNSSGTSREAVVELPEEDHFNVLPAWEADYENFAHEEGPKEELTVGEPASDTEAFGASLESIYHQDEEDHLTQEGEDNGEDEKNEDDSIENDEDTKNTETHTFEAISSEDESLNKAETVEEIPAVYSEDALPETVAIETGDYFSFDDVELDTDTGKEEVSETTLEKNAAEDDAEEEFDGEDFSLELDYSEEDENK